jgi:hypothetical protein
MQPEEQLLTMPKVAIPSLSAVLFIAGGLAALAWLIGGKRI